MTTPWFTSGDTTLGLKRAENQDRFFVHHDGCLLVLADGMGGMVDGGGAADIAVRAAVEAYDARGLACRSDTVARIFETAHRRVSRTPGSGTTLTVALIDRDTVVIGHAGDSPAYFTQPGTNGTLERLTHDHVGAHRNALTNYVGHPTGGQPDVSAFLLPRGCVLLLCSDGVSSYVDRKDIARIMEPGPTGPGARVRELLKASLAVGGEDNATAVIGMRGPQR